MPLLSLCLLNRAARKGYVMSNYNERTFSADDLGALTLTVSAYIKEMTVKGDRVRAEWWHANGKWNATVVHSYEAIKS